jgi:hypothetical protein
MIANKWKYICNRERSEGVFRGIGGFGCFNVQDHSFGASKEGYKRILLELVLFLEIKKNYWILPQQGIKRFCKASELVMLFFNGQLRKIYIL